MGENVSSGRVLVFTKVADGWRQTAELKGSDPATDIFGRSLSVSGTTLVVGADARKGVGRAYVFEKTATGWTQTGELEGSDTAAGDNFGAAVAVSGTTAVVGGASNHANKYRASVRVHQDGEQVEASRGAEGLVLRRPGCHLRQDHRRGWGLRRGVRVHEHGEGLDEDRRTEGLRDVDHQLGEGPVPLVDGFSGTTLVVGAVG